MQIISDYYNAINNEKIKYIKQLKSLYPLIYFLHVEIEHDYGTCHKVVGCHTDENVLKSLIGSGKWLFYCSGEGSESYQFKIVPKNNYDVNDFDLLININKIDMSNCGKMN